MLHGIWWNATEFIENIDEIFSCYTTFIPTIVFYSYVHNVYNILEQFYIVKCFLWNVFEIIEEKDMVCIKAEV